MKIKCLGCSACILVLAALLATPMVSNAAGVSSRTDSVVNHVSLQRMVSCLVGDKSFRIYALKFDNLKLGDWSVAKFHSGPVVDRSYNGKVYNVILYSKDKKRSVIGLVIPDKNDNLEVVQNGYLLVRHGNTWRVEEGNGGYHDYETIGKFVTSLGQKPYSLVHVVSQSNACSAQVRGYSGHD